MTFQFPTTVSRYVWSGAVGQRWVKLAEYADAEVRDGGDNNLIGLGARYAMLRGYSSDPAAYGEDDEARAWTEEDEKRHLASGGCEGDWEIGVFYDMDGDLALSRVEMDAVVSSHNFGSGSIDYVGVVSFRDREAYGSGSREVNEWHGSGDLSKVRLEMWSVRLREETA